MTDIFISYSRDDQAIADYRTALAIDPDLQIPKNNLKLLGVDI